MFLLIDNYDSFTYNVVHLLGDNGIHIGKNLTIKRNDDISIKDAMAIGNEAMIISPGPATPKTAGISIPLIKSCIAAKRPVFGICLGLQAMVEAFGGHIATYQPPRHGKISDINCDNDSWLFKNIPQKFSATRYHSLAITTLPSDLLAIATSCDDKQIMAIQHKHLPMAAVQFHPESYYCQYGKAIIKNFLTFILKNSMA
ncbi:MAG: anthranilate synthase component II [Alphaproteobacteria bacterium]